MTDYLPMKNAVWIDLFSMILQLIMAVHGTLVFFYPLEMETGYFGYAMRWFKSRIEHWDSMC